LFKTLIAKKEPQKRRIALQVLAKNAKNIPYEKLTKNFEEEEEVDPSLNNLYARVFEEMDSNLRHALIMKSLTHMQVMNLELEVK
jgi:hypothetical protein